MADLIKVKTAAQRHLDILEGQVITLLVPLKDWNGSIKPWLPDWQNNAHASADTLPEGTEHVGQLCWPNTDLLVIDVDDMSKLADLHDLGLPETRVYTTKHGQHWYYYFPASKWVGGPKQGKLPLGAGDWKGGYVRHHNLSTNDQPIVPAPEWLCELALATDGKIGHVFHGEAWKPVHLSKGMRATDIYRLACKLVRGGYEGEMLLGLCRGHAAQHYTPALEDGRIVTAVKSAMKHFEPPLKITNRETAADLFDADLPEVKYFVDELVTPGLVILAGRPKLGKSFMALQLGTAIATGTPFLGLDTIKAEVIYWSLEDGRTRIGNRIKQGGLSSPMAVQHIQNPTGLFELMKEDIAEVHIVDTGVRAFPIEDYNDTHKKWGPIQAWAMANDKLVVFVWHVTKKGHNDKGEIIDRGFEGIHGSQGIIAASDTQILLETSKLRAQGRDIADRELKLKHEGMWWRSMEEVALVDRQILAALVGGPYTKARLMDECPDIPNRTLDRHIAAMCKEGRIAQPRRGVYALPTDVRG